ncbi:MAG: G8 domain-containing protein [Planctomycetota bacterium]
MMKSIFSKLGLSTGIQRQDRARSRFLRIENLEAKKLLAALVAGDANSHDQDHPAMVGASCGGDDGGSSGGSQGDHGGTGHGDGSHDGMMHAAAMNLVPDEQVTHRAVNSGSWSNPENWEDRQIPTSGAHILIPESINLTIDSVMEEEFMTLRLDGTLNFAPDRDTELRVDTLVSTPTGHLIIGTAEDPIRADATARVLFADSGAIDRDWDPSLLSRGALLHGKTTIHGAEKSSFIGLAGLEESGANAAVRGSTQVLLSDAPVGWRVGDTITIAGVDPNDPSSDEVVTITGIDGQLISFEDDPLENDHIAPRAGLEVHVANLTRNVIFGSMNTHAEHRAHMMFMHTNDVDLRYAAFQGMGRTDKSIDLEDWRLVSESEGSVGPENTEVEELGGFNVRGRYSVHFHRGGSAGEPAIVQGSVVRDDPGWAYVNHSSNVDFLNNVSHNVTGAAFNTEAGDEVGSFIRNIAIRTVNPNANPNPPDDEIDPDQSPDIRVLTQDFGWQGDGFWFHGAGVTVEDNVVSGASGHGFIYWTLGLVEEGLGENLVDVANLQNGELIGPDGTLVRPKHVPVPSFDGNTAYNAPKGLNIAYLHTDNRDDNDAHWIGEGVLAPVPPEYEDQLQSTFSNFTAWNVPLSGVAAPYSGRLTFENINLFGTAAEGSVGLKLDQFANQNDITVRNVMIDGYLTGIAAQRQGDAIIDGAEISAVTDIRVNVPDTTGRDLDIRNVEFLSLSDVFEPGEERVNIDLNAAYDLGLAGGLFGIEDEFFDEPTLLNVPPIFQRDRITLNIPGYENVGLFFDPQAPEFVPVPEGGELAKYVRSELVGLTNAELQEQFGISFSDALTPEDAAPAAILRGGVFGTALPEFASAPPGPDPYWVEYLSELGVGLPASPPTGGDDSGNDPPGDEEEDEATDPGGGDGGNCEAPPPADDDHGDDDHGDDDHGDDDHGDDDHGDDDHGDDDHGDDDHGDDDHGDDDHGDDDHGDNDHGDNDHGGGSDDRGHGAHGGQMEERDSGLSLHNAGMPMDVNNDGFVSPADVLTIVNHLTRNSSGLIRELALTTQDYIDVNGDDAATPIDVLLVVNFLNRYADTSAEAEPGSQVASFPSDRYSLGLLDQFDDEFVDRLAEEHWRRRGIS